MGDSQRPLVQQHVAGKFEPIGDDSRWVDHISESHTSAPALLMAADRKPFNDLQFHAESDIHAVQPWCAAANHLH